MSSATEPQDQLRQQANDLYWNSSDTVDQLATRLGMSRKALYGTVEPIQAGATCTTCGDPLVFTNRTRRSTGTASCTSCGSETRIEVDQVEPLDAPRSPAEMIAESANGEVHEVPASQSGWEQIKEDLSHVSPERAAKIGGAAALGVAIGAAAVKAIKKRS
jgi:transcription elongation factor Elf1